MLASIGHIAADGRQRTTARRRLPDAWPLRLR